MTDALGYVTDGENLLRRAIIGTLLMLGSILIIPGFMLSGYYLRVARSAYHGESQPPVFNDWVGLLMLGLKFLVVSFVYGLILIIPLIAAMMGVQAGSGVGTIGLLLVVVGGLALSYLAPAGVVFMAEKGKIEAAFDFGRIKRVAGTRNYAVGFILATVINIVGNLVGQLLAVVIIGLPIIFFAQMAMWYVFGDAVRKAEERVDKSSVDL